MNLSKTLCKKAIFVTFAAASALAGGSASAQSGPIHTTLFMYNANSANTCVRAYVNGRQYDLNAQREAASTTNVSNNKSYMASVFKGQRCGGAAIKNVWFKVGKFVVNKWDIK